MMKLCLLVTICFWQLMDHEAIIAHYCKCGTNAIIQYLFHQMWSHEEDGLRWHLYTIILTFCVNDTTLCNVKFTYVVVLLVWDVAIMMYMYYLFCPLTLSMIATLYCFIGSITRWARCELYTYRPSENNWNKPH